MRQEHFYPRPPRGGRRIPAARRMWQRYFYPRPPRGGRPFQQVPLGLLRRISIHALREEGDAMLFFSGSKHRKFLSTPSARRATWILPKKTPPRIFLSTPSARRATHDHPGTARHGRDFYPRPPRGGRPYDLTMTYPIVDFYPRPPRGGRHRFFYPDHR